MHCWQDFPPSDVLSSELDLQVANSLDSGNMNILTIRFLICFRCIDLFGVGG